MNRYVNNKSGAGAYTYNIDWNSLGFMTGGRYMFSQKALKEAPIDGKLFD